MSELSFALGLILLVTGLLSTLISLILCYRIDGHEFSEAEVEFMLEKEAEEEKKRLEQERLKEARLEAVEHYDHDIDPYDQGETGIVRAAH